MIDGLVVIENCRRMSTISWRELILLLSYTPTMQESHRQTVSHSVIVHIRSEIRVHNRTNTIFEQVMLYQSGFPVMVTSSSICMCKILHCSRKSMLYLKKKSY